jgi:hypothetical protein
MRHFKISNLLLAIVFSCVSTTFAQSTGDTIKVNALNFNSTTRDTLVSFPDLDLSYEKILLKYTMRCKDGLVSTSTDSNIGCGEWDYSCNTYVVDSTKIEEVENYIPSHFITNFEGTNFSYKKTPVYDYYRGMQTRVNVETVENEVNGTIGNGEIAIPKAIQTDSLSGKSQYLYLASELLDAGLVAGEIDGLGLDVLTTLGEANFLMVNMKQTSQTVISDDNYSDDFKQVYYYDTKFESSKNNRLNFSSPFIWDGSSNCIVEFSFTNINANKQTETFVKGHLTSNYTGISATNGKHLLLANDAYIECNDYKGIMGDQNRTIEAWIKTSSETNAEICSWGESIVYQKWTFRLTNTGQLRLENGSGGTVSSTSVNDGEWHHVACVLDGDNLSNISFYIDGIIDANSSVGTTAINTTEGINVRISRGTNERYLDAEIDQVRIWNTNLSSTTINNWMRLKVNSSHPNYENLQLLYNFDETGSTIIDESANAINASLIGAEYRISNTDAVNFFKDFELQNERPNLTFYQGEYVLSAIDSLVDRPVETKTKYFVTERTIESTSSDQAIDDSIHSSEANEYWLATENIYNDTTGVLIITNNLTPDGEITINDLSYFRRFPYYNELVSFVTPYGIGLDFGMEGKSWYFDMSDYVHLLKDNKRLLMTLGGQLQEDIDLEFQFIVGTPPRDVLQYDQIWQGTNRMGVAFIDDILTDVKFAPTKISTSAQAAAFKLKSSITGHGSEGEFGQNGGEIEHKILFNNTEKLNWTITQKCSDNPIYPQGGTWVYDRQGWCPGEPTLITESDVTAYITAGDSVDIDYNTSNPEVTDGTYKYHVTHQLIAYGSANHTLDAAITEILAPNNGALYTRVGTICANPTVIIQNTGTTPLMSLTIEYWINESQQPQSYQWTGELDFMESEEVIIPSTRELWFDILETGNLFHVNILDPNGGEDQYEYNNTFTSSFDITEILPTNFAIEFRTNNYSYENKYELIDAEGNVVGSNDLTEANTTYTDDYEISDNCYKLIVTDTGGDGVSWWANTSQGTGYIHLKDEQGNIIKTFEPDFGAGFEYSFSINSLISAKEFNFLTSIKVFPNPINEYCVVQLNDVCQVEIFITNLNGQRVETIISGMDNSEIYLNMEHLLPGMYLVNIKNNDIITTRKVIKR